MSDHSQQSPTPPAPTSRPMRQALALLLTLTGGLLLGAPAKSEAAMMDPASFATPPASTTTVKSFKERVQQTRDQLMVANPEDAVEGTQVYWRNWANWRWGNGGWRNWNNWNNWKNWSNWSNWHNW